MHKNSEILETKVLMAGATGLVGGELLRLINHSEKNVQVVSMLRKKSVTLFTNSKFREIEVSFAELSNQTPLEHGLTSTFTHAVCCLGTTIKKAGSKEKFIEVDKTFVLNFFRFAKLCGVQTAVVVSALGADINSSVFYSRVKGEMEHEIQQLGFQKVVILRPSLLLGKRREFRPAERLGIVLAPVLNLILQGPLKKYRPIKASEVAKQLLDAVMS